MFGLVFGTLCLLGLIATLRRRHYGPYSFAHAHAFGPGGWGGHRHGSDYAPSWPGRSYSRRGGLLRMFFERLETTPGQEKAISALVARERDRLRGNRDELTSARKAIAAAVGGDEIDRGVLEAARTRHTDLAHKLSHELIEDLVSVHEVLDGKQRRQLAELIADGPSWRRLRHF